MYKVTDVKPLEFCGAALADLKRFPEKVRTEAGRQLRRVQHGLDPHDWKPMNPVAPGAREIRLRDLRGAFRVLYVANIRNTVHVLHCFMKKTEKTSFSDLSLARQRYRAALKPGARSMKTETFDSVWDALEATPEAAQNMTLRCDLMIALEEYIKENALSQAQAAKIFGVTQPRVSDLVRGKIDLFSLDSLINMAVAAGMKVELRISRRTPRDGHDNKKTAAR